MDVQLDGAAPMVKSYTVFVAVFVALTAICCSACAIVEDYDTEATAGVGLSCFGCILTALICGFVVGGSTVNLLCVCFFVCVFVCACVFLCVCLFVLLVNVSGRIASPLHPTVGGCSARGSTR